MSGKTKPLERSDEVDAFNKRAKERPSVFVMSIFACGVGINLHTATKVILASPLYNPMYEAQAAARAHRIGQTKPVTVYRLAFDGAYDMKVQVRGRFGLYVLCSVFPMMHFMMSGNQSQKCIFGFCAKFHRNDIVELSMN